MDYQGQFGSFIHSLADRLHGDHYICHVWKPKCSNKNFSDRNKTFALCSFVIFVFLIFEPSVTKENLWLKTCQQSFIASFIDMNSLCDTVSTFPLSWNSFHSLCYFLALQFHLCVTCGNDWMPLRWQWTGVLRWASHGNASQKPLGRDRQHSGSRSLLIYTRSHDVMEPLRRRDGNILNQCKITYWYSVVTFIDSNSTGHDILMGKWYNNLMKTSKAVTGVEVQNLKGTSFGPFFMCTTKQTIRLSIQFGPTMGLLSN